ncbi:MAG: hypothetical protein COB46_09860 [Rhodospirillaceae bacterium]|nr:MAG: hypothetical protein COB46_09860 [Rhodospirillaceae bacterium]
MFFKKKHPSLDTPMEQFINRENLNTDERAVLDVYLTGAVHALAGANAVQISNARDPLFIIQQDENLDIRQIEDLLADFLEHRPDMQSQPLGLCAVLAVMHRFPV